MTRAPDLYVISRLAPSVPGGVEYLREHIPTSHIAWLAEDASVYSATDAALMARAMNLACTPTLGRGLWVAVPSVISVPPAYSPQEKGKAERAHGHAGRVDLSGYCEGQAGEQAQRRGVDVWPIQRLMDLQSAMQWLLDSLHDAGETHGEDGRIYDCVEHAAAALVDAVGTLGWYSPADARDYRRREAAEAQAEAAPVRATSRMEATGGPHAWDDGEIARGLASGGAASGASVDIVRRNLIGEEVHSLFAHGVR